MNILAVIPARGGSKGIPRKNVRLINGKPLISYAINNALGCKYITTVVVSTDDEEISRISSMWGAQVIKRPESLALDMITLDPVVWHAAQVSEQTNHIVYDCVITMQPTSPLLSVQTLDTAIEFFMGKGFDTVLSGVNRPHLAWTEKEGKYIPLYEKRLNRQYLPKYLLETGAFVISKREYVQETSRFGPNVGIFETPENESVDIDSPRDWWIADKELAKKSILIRTDGYTQIGMGHIFRGLLLAYNLINHDVRFVLSKKSDLGIAKIRNSHFQYDVIEENEEIYRLVDDYKCDIIINDILDTSKKYIRKLKELGVRVVNFEDLGRGADDADAVINALYEKQKEGIGYFWGSDYYCLRDEFIFATPKPFSEKVSNVLVLFGGTDPSDLTSRLLSVVLSLPSELDIRFTFILGMGYDKRKEIIESASLNRNIQIIQEVNLITDYMGQADLAISSQGRTMLELASMGVPTILLAQNSRELHHEFGNLQNGFISLGLGNTVKDQTIRETMIWLINSPQIRKQMRHQMLSVDLRKGIDRVLDIILDRYI